jgi:hypothetical protein
MAAAAEEGEDLGARGSGAFMVVFVAAVLSFKALEDSLADIDEVGAR